MKLKFIAENSGISQKTNKPYNMIKLADPNSLENHMISFDPNQIKSPIPISKGQLVEIDGELTTPYSNTQFFATSIKAI